MKLATKSTLLTAALIIFPLSNILLLISVHFTATPDVRFAVKLAPPRPRQPAGSWQLCAVCTATETALLRPSSPRFFRQRSYHIQDPAEHGTKSVSAVDDPHRPFADLRAAGGGGALALANSPPDPQSYPNWERLTTVRAPHTRPSSHATALPSP